MVSRELITRDEVDFLRALHERSLKTCVDVYIAYLEGHPVEEGADLEYVFTVVWAANYRMLKHELGWATVLFVQTQWELSKSMLYWQMQLLAKRKGWRDSIDVIARSMVCFARLAKILFRHYSGLTVPAVGLSDFVAVYSYTGQRGRP